jgi:DnaA family protein
MKQLLLEFPSQSPTLANFVPGENGELLYQLRELASGRSNERMVYLWGEAGCGRTHLLLACAEAASGIYVHCEAETRFEFDVDFVAVDDVGALDEAGQIALFHLYNRLKEAGGALLVSGDEPPARLDVREDLATRLGWGLVYQVRPLLDEEKRSALSAHAKDMGFEISVEVVDYLMHHVRRDLPTLMKMLDALDEFSREAKRPITIPLLKEVIERMKCD